MGFTIKDGTGSNREVRVDEAKRLEVASFDTNRVADIANRTGDAFLLASDFITLTTTGSTNGLMYVKNNADTNLYIDKIRVCGQVTTPGMAMYGMQVRILSNPTTGDIITDANLADTLSSNVGSSREFEGLAYSASGDSRNFTDGTNMTQFIGHIPGHSIQEYGGSLLLPKGSAIGIVAQPQVAGTICVEVQCWFE